MFIMHQSQRVGRNGTDFFSFTAAVFLSSSPAARRSPSSVGRTVLVFLIMVVLDYDADLSL